jgi:decaprenyl-phosphate phosphoribosyltransferase
MSELKSYLRLMRPHQYSKNAFVWFPLLFGHKAHDLLAVLQTLAAFALFCLISSGVYIINDLRDLEEDRRHPTKKNRVLPSGKASRAEAITLSALCIGLSLGAAILLLDRRLCLILAAYLLLNVAYSWWLKRLAIIDVVCIAVGFVLRVFAGGVAAGIWPSHWLVLMTFLLALFLALAKRRDDLLLATAAYRPRASLYGYNMEFISLSMALMGGVIVVSYILYTVSPEVMSKHHTENLYLTVFWVILGLLRYLQFTIVKQQSGSPTSILLRDRFLQMVIVFWLISCYVILYVYKP